MYPRLDTNLKSPCLSLLEAGIIGICYHNWFTRFSSELHPEVGFGGLGSMSSFSLTHKLAHVVWRGALPATSLCEKH